jgi:XrtJ-associated TM-motif-TM protein
MLIGSFLHLFLARGRSMRKWTFVILGAAMLFSVTATLRAQTGCDDSPEDPTIALALVSGAGVLAASLWRSRRR